MPRYCTNVISNTSTVVSKFVKPEPAKLTSISQTVELNLMKRCRMCAEHFVTISFQPNHIMTIHGKIVVVCVCCDLTISIYFYILPHMSADHTYINTIVPPRYSVSCHKWVCQDFSDVTLAWMCLWSRWRRRICPSATGSSPPSSRTSRKEAPVTNAGDVR